MNLRRLVLFYFLALCGIAAAFSPATPRAFNIKTYVSASGRFEFTVDPTEFSGIGPGDSQLKQNGRVIWKTRLPFTFHEARVADDGTVAGYGYALGKKSGFPSGIMDEKELRFVIFGPDGRQRLEKKFIIDGDAYNYAMTGYLTLDIKGMSLNDERFAFFMGNSGLCRSYRTSNGKSLGVMTPPMPVVAGEERVDCSLEAVVQIEGTPFTLLHWLVDDRQQTRVDRGAIFTLIDSNGAQVWELIALRDYTNPDKRTEARIMGVLQESGAIFKTGKAGTFEVWLAKNEQRVRYAVQNKNGQWNVAEVSREPYELKPPEQKKTLSIEAPELDKLGSFLLEAPPLTGPVTDASAFGFDGRGRIGFLRGRGHFVLVEPNGDLSAEIPLQLPKDLPADAKVFLIWIADDRWLVTASPYDEDSIARAWWVDTEKKTMTEVEGFECLRIDSLAGAGDGGFVVLTHTPMEFSSNLVVAFDAAGKKRWSITANQDFTPESFFSPDSISVTTRGEVAVLDQARQTVHHYDLGGKHLRTVELEKEWKSDNTTAQDITADADGGFIVHKSSGEPPFVRMTAEGKVRAEFATKFKHGGVPANYGEIRVAPDGRMWQNNRHNFVRIGEDGVVDEIVGTKADADKLGVIAVATTDAKERIYLADDQTSAVHVFSPEGHKVHVCKPRVPDHGRSHVAGVTNEGSVYLQSNWSDERYMVFGANGSRETDVPANFSNYEWQARRESGGMLMKDGHELLLTDKSLAVKRTINRWPDRRWFDYCESAAIAEDGSFAILGGSGPETGLLGFYSPDGDPLRMARLPVEWDTEQLTLAGWNRKNIVINYRSQSIICDREGKPVGLLSVPAEEGKWAQFVMREGRELWILEFESRKITRYAMPSGG